MIVSISDCKLLSPLLLYLTSSDINPSISVLVYVDIGAGMLFIWFYKLFSIDIALFVSVKIKLSTLVLEYVVD